MKPFDLERAKAGDPILYKGSPARFIAHVPDANEEYRFIFLTCKGFVCNAPECGGVFLEMAPIKKQVWVNLYMSNLDVLLCYKHDSEQNADTCAGSSSDRLGGKAHLIEWEE